MRSLAVGFILLLSACAPASEPTTTPAPPARQVVTTTTVAPLHVEIDDCSSPQVTFSPLCEMYELIEEWHVDRPPDPAALARAAFDGLADFETTDTEDPPRAVICAIPDPVFGEFCKELGRRVDESSIPIGAAVEAAVISMTDTGLDPFSYYVPLAQVDSFRLNGVVGGVGILVNATDAVGSTCARVSPVCELRIVFVLEDNPGAEAGLETDDVIVAIDGEPVEGLGFVEAGSRIAGDENGEVSLTIDRDGRDLEFSIFRDELTVPTVEVRHPAPAVGYIRIPDFESDIPGLVVDGLIALDEEPYSTLVVDLRDNPGGFIDSAIAVMSEFVDGGVILVEADGTEEFEYEANEGGLAINKRLLVLVNQGTASAAEVMAAALRDTRDAVIIGEATFGKHAIQIVFDLNNGAEFHLAIAHWVSPRGVSVGDGGLIPDHEAAMPASMSPSELVDLALEIAG